MGTSTHTLKQKAYREMKEFLAIAFYLWVVFVVLEVHKSIILGEHHIDVPAHGLALINALALAKVMHLGRKLHLGELANAPPLIYPTLLKSALFTLALACFKILEDAVIGYYHGQTFQQSIADIGGGTGKGILSLAGIVFVVLIPFFAFTELEKVVGEGKLEKVFFHRHEALNPPDSSHAEGGTRITRDDLQKRASA